MRRYPDKPDLHRPPGTIIPWALVAFTSYALAAETDKLDGLPVNIGSGRGTPIREIAEQLSDVLKIDIAPEIGGEFRPGEMRHLISDTTLARSAGYKPTVDLSDGIGRYIDWIRAQSDIRDYFSEASEILKNKGIVHRVAR